MVPSRYPIAIDMLTSELERMEQNHWSDGADTTDGGKYAPCDGCIQAAAVRSELEALCRIEMETPDGTN